MNEDTRSSNEKTHKVFHPSPWPQAEKKWVDIKRVSARLVFKIFNIY